MVIRMGEFEMTLDPQSKAYMDDQAWLALAENERLVRDTGLPFSEENVDWTKRHASRTAVYRTLVRYGVILEAHLDSGLLL
jgi:predicted alpha-1,6-mannanase (GH76 family)